MEPDTSDNEGTIRRSVGYSRRVDEDLHERIRAAVAAVPAGTVATYGDIAALSGAPTPRLVGRVLGEDGHDLPWHRIIRANGTPAPHLRREQLALLRAEGILAEGDKIRLHTYRMPAPESPRR
jgi:methylated-DNA-protein-cysteine methyltransferase related protein